MQNQWEPQIQEFEAADKVTRPPGGCVVFTGSSTIAMWQSLAADFPFVHAINRGFGGSCYSDVALFARRIVTPCMPSLVVAYAGDNDLASGLSPQQVLRNLEQFVTNVRHDLPEAPIVIIGVKPSPSRWSLSQTMRQTNRLIEQYAHAGRKLQYVSLFDAMLGADGQPRAELYLEDQLHMSPAGYSLWTQVLTPILQVRS